MTIVRKITVGEIKFKKGEVYAIQLFVRELLEKEMCNPYPLLNDAAKELLKPSPDDTPVGSEDITRQMVARSLMDGVVYGIFERYTAKGCEFRIRHNNSTVFLFIPDDWFVLDEFHQHMGIGRVLSVRPMIHHEKE